MKRNILILIGLLLIGHLEAQVGINTLSPKGILHIDSRGDTNGNLNVSDDVVMNKNGNMGIGTIDPKERLDIRGTMRIVDGNQDTGNIFTAIDTNGTGTWKPANTSAAIGTWCIADSTTYFYKTADEQIVYGKSSAKVDNSQIALSMVDNYRLTVPVGKYLIFLNQDIGFAEYGTYRIRNANNPSDIIYQQNYAEWLAGSCFIWFVSVPTTIYITWEAIDMHAISNGYYNEISASSTVRRTIMNFSEITFLSLT